MYSPASRARPSTTWPYTSNVIFGDECITRFAAVTGVELGDDVARHEMA